MDTIWNITDLIVLGAGFYALYAAYVLRTQGKIIKTFLVFKDTDVSSCKDLQGYANLMSPKPPTMMSGYPTRHPSPLRQPELRKKLQTELISPAKI